MKKNIKKLIYSFVVIGMFLLLANGCNKSDDPSNPATSGTVTDVDGNIYHTVTIGTQVWMIENLKTTKYRNGDPITNVMDNTAWRTIKTEAYCNYNNDASIGSKYGKIYNGYAVNDSRNIAPTGWHIPSQDEWTILKNYLTANLGTSGSVAKALSAQTDWASSTEAGAIGNDLTKNNTSGFNALPGGFRGGYAKFGSPYYGEFYDNGSSGSWWSSTDWYDAYENTDMGIGYGLYSDESNLDSQEVNKGYGFSVRCIKGEASSLSAELPSLSTIFASNINTNSAISGGIIAFDGGSSVSERGICYSTSQNPTVNDSKIANGSGIGIFNSTMTGLSANTIYYVRAYAKNIVGTAYGNQVLFIASEGGFGNAGTFNDIEGNLYHSVIIGSQIWMVENLKTTKFNDGNSIPNVMDDTSWNSLNSPAYCWYNNEATYKNTYGALYNWFAVKSGKLAPVGWHLPTDKEWLTLTTFLGDMAADKLKETGTSHWFSPNTGATNITGFTALPGGSRNLYGGFNYIGYSGYWWSYDVDYNTWPWFMHTSLSTVSQLTDYKQVYGFSVRCIKD